MAFLLTAAPLFTKPVSFMPPSVNKQVMKMKVVKCSTRNSRAETRFKSEAITLHKRSQKGEVSREHLEAKVKGYGIKPTPELMLELLALLERKNSGAFKTRFFGEYEKAKLEMKKPVKQEWMRRRKMPRSSRNKHPPTFMSNKVREDIKSLQTQVQSQIEKGNDDGVAAALKLIKQSMARYGAIPSDAEARRMAGLGKGDFFKAAYGRIQTQEVNVRKWEQKMDEREAEKMERVEKGDGGGNLGTIVNVNINPKVMKIYINMPEEKTGSVEEDKKKKPSGGGEGEAGGDVEKKTPSVEEDKKKKPSGGGDDGERGEGDKA